MVVFVMGCVLALYMMYTHDMHMMYTYTYDIHSIQTEYIVEEMLEETRANGNVVEVPMVRLIKEWKKGTYISGGQV